MERSYRVPEIQKGVLIPSEFSEVFSVQYSVGQPMGALSSFNMLALTHHMILQDCAMRLGLVSPGTWFDAYEITGDDLVVFDARVARLYEKTMATLGLEINLKKSVISIGKAAGEYLKKT